MSPGHPGGQTQPPVGRANVPVRTGLTACWRQAADNLRSRKCGGGHGEVFGFTEAAGRSQLAVIVRGQRVGVMVRAPYPAAGCCSGLYAF